MQIQWLGLSCFRIQTKHSTIITDPYTSSFGLTLPKLKCSIVVSSDPSNELSSNIERLSGDPFTITGPGEYEIGSTFIYGVPGSNTIYIIEDEHIRVGFLGALDTDLSTEQLEIIESVDILLLPVGTLSKGQRTSVVSQIEPRVVIPYLFTQAGIKKLELEPIDVFLKEMAAQAQTPIDKYTIKHKDLPQDETQVHILTPVQ